MNPRLVSCYFAGPAEKECARMARVLEYTARRHCPGWAIDVARIEPPAARSARGSAWEAANTQKLDHWAARVAAAPDGTPMLLMDADTMILHSLDDVWARPFDVAYTVRDVGGMRFPLNGGVVFLRVSPGTRRFVETWRAENRKMLENAAYHAPWNRRFGGINQAALGKVLESSLVAELKLNVLKLPCSEWNAEDTSWARFDPARTRIVHVKSGLRRAVFGPNVSAMAPYRALAVIWRRLEKEAAQQGQRAEVRHEVA